MRYEQGYSTSNSCVDWDNAWGGVPALHVEEVARALKSVERVRRFAERARARMVLVMFSGGVDSSLALAASIEALGLDRVAAATAVVPGQTTGEHMAVVRAVAESMGLTVEKPTSGKVIPKPGRLYMVYRSGGDFWALLERYGLPAQARGRKRWCCAKFKNEPLSRVLCRARVAGYRIDESRWRARLLSNLDRDLPMLRFSDGLVLAPIFDYTRGEVWGELRRLAPEAAGVLEDWYSRHSRGPGCAFCVVAGRRALEEQARGLPDGLLLRAIGVVDKLSRRHTGVSGERAWLMLEVLRREAERRGLLARSTT